MENVIAKEKNINILKNIIDGMNLSESQRKRVEYQIVGDILSGIDLKDIKSYLIDRKVLWNHETFSDDAKKIQEVQFFLSNPVEAVSGIFTCIKCGHDKTISFSKQVRSADEGTSVFVKCVSCNNTWTHSG